VEGEKMAENYVNSTHKLKANDEQIKEMLSYYDGYITYNTSDYIKARVKTTNITITFYKTNVVLFQVLAKLVNIISGLQNLIFLVMKQQSTLWKNIHIFPQ
jgi:ribonuclease HIII